MGVLVIFSSEIVSDLVLIMRHGVVHVHDQFFFVNSALRIRVFLP
jgi:hypothetical protein